MTSTSFSIAQVNRLRRAAERARELPDEHRDPGLEGWFAGAYDASEPIGVFDTLRLKAGFALHAYEFRAALAATASSERCRPTPRCVPQTTISG